MKVIEAYQKAYKDITEKGYNTQAWEFFSDGPYEGIIYLVKSKATRKSKIRTLYKVRFKGSRYLLVKQDKQDFLNYIGFIK